MTTGSRADYELEVWARTVLIGTRQPAKGEKVKAYRILAKVNPKSYLPLLAEALVSLSYGEYPYTPAEARLPLLEEAMTAARLAGNRNNVLADVLNAYQIALYEAGRRAEGLAACEELAATSPRHKTTYARALAEEGRHGEAAALLADCDASMWERLALIAQLDAGSQAETAVAALVPLIAEEQAGLLADKTSVSNVFYLHIWYAALLGHTGRPQGAAQARREALGLARRLATFGEPRSWSGAQFTFAGIFLGALAADAEPVTPGRPRPARGWEPGAWSRDLRADFFEGAGTPRCKVERADLPGTLLHEAQHETRVPELALLYRRIALRTGLYWLWHQGHRSLEPGLPYFDESVEAARRWHGEDESAGRPALVRALTDRAMFLVSGCRYQQAHADYEQALNLTGS